MQKEIITAQNTIHIGQSSNDVLGDFLRTKYKGKKITIITDDNVFENWIEQIVTSVSELHEAEIIQLPAGEDSKCIEIASQIWETLSENKVGRGDLVINFGGGVITDLGGFVSSVYKRGIAFVNIPTSLLAQVDASVGGKTGINLGPYKNQIGAFSDSELVLINPLYLGTLPPAELSSGYAEMLKHGLISSKTHWNDLKSIDYQKTEKLTGLIYDSIQIKSTIVNSDPTEKNQRKTLNFGHTIGHAIEGYLNQNEQTIKHGHAIALGMIAESYISYKQGLLNKKDWDEIYYILTDKFEKIYIDPVQFPHLIQLMENDKKNIEGQINFTLLSEIGTSSINHEISTEEILDALLFTLV